MEIRERASPRESVLEETLSIFPSSLRFLEEQNLGSLNSEEKLDIAEKVMEVSQKLGFETRRGREYLEAIRQKKEEVGSGKQLEALIETGFEGIRKAYDPITGFAKEYYIREGLVGKIQERIQKNELPPLTFITVDVDGLHNKNLKYGRERVNIGYRALGEYLAGELEGLRENLPEECEMFAYRKGETGDEIDIVIIGLNKEQAERLEIMKNPKWPTVTIGGDQVEMSATVGVAYSDDLSPEIGGKIPTALEGLYKIAETRVRGLKSER